MSLFDENDKNDFFEESNVTEKPKEPKKPKYTPEDPRYWDEPESEYEHLKPSHKSRWKLWGCVFAVAVLIGLIWVTYIQVFKPYVMMATEYGYVESIVKKGNVIETFEGVMIPYESFIDSTRQAGEDGFRFSTRNDSIAARLFEMQYSRQPVRVRYNVYHTAMPWRGDTRNIITGVDSVGVEDVLPLGYQSEESDSKN